MSLPVLTSDQIVSLHSLSGVTVFQFTPQDYSQLSWTRDQNNAGTCDLSAPPLQNIDRLPDIAPWLHWLTVWDGSDSSILWQGPIQKATSSRAGLVINCKDPAAYLAKTRSPVTKRWDNTDPAFIAAELWQRMVQLQGLHAKPVARADPDGQLYDFQTTQDEKMLDQAISDLVDLGMVWTVISGVPIIGPIGRDPVATLSDADFTGQDDIQLVRDGTSTSNDVLIKAEGSNVNAAVPYYGQSLQTLKNLDHLSDISNVTRAAQAYVKKLGTVQTRLSMPSGAVLNPDAAVTMDQLMPSTRFIIETQGIRQLMQLTQVQVDRSSGASTVKVTMGTALTTTEVRQMELDRATDDKRPNVSLGSAAAQR